MDYNGCRKIQQQVFEAMSRGDDRDAWLAVKNHKDAANHAATLDYDMTLRTAGSIGTYIEQPFQIVSWRELTDPAEQISL